ncbi:MAG: FeS-binding protein, partial [Euryarchaeota archaeon]|nr:FeS-binding protein [Euryarchaeota archaeon]
MKTVTDILHYEFGKLHAKFRTISIIHLKDLHAEINEWKRNGLITEKFFKQNYGEFTFQPPTTLRNACSIIVIGIPQKITPIEFFHKGKRYQTVIPPTYVYSEVRTACKEILSRILQKKGYSVDRAKLPLKLLAVKSGLGQYGKNNICYVDGMGSFTRLEAFYTDYEFPTDDWHEKEIMESCTTCSLCQNACPTHCIPKERFLIHADHCLTYLNENKEDFPSWVTLQSHNALVGCMHCQIVCPQNKKFLQLNEKTINFSEEETSIILQKTPREHVSPTLAKKLAVLDIDEYYSLLERNL